jgi:osmotically-inducible protein OsmY
MNRLNRLIAVVLLGAGVASVQTGMVQAQPASGGSFSSDAVAHSNRYFRNQSPEDKQLTRNVRRQIAKLKGVDVSDISVSSRDGVVRLTGTVQRADHLQQVTAAVEKIPGVTSVINALAIRTRM